ncbi:hypothetical protein M407DRAFT_29885 [Tulasnella calospora MUT 4182]|uniref:F-box domain-containing protein n=1 Tax=Tulasnella calospora MUT 4182 TaxID=1051891 RepID=A0A0C3KG72_9AGAM|nr:hypothetical protein M407DRAFT_29885 [Tulasnella calospora MUT 4182]
MASGLQQRIQELLIEYLADFQSQSTQSQGASAHISATQIFRLDEELACLQNVHDAISAEISARVTRVSTHRNSLLPIHRLPLELLSYVLEASLGHFDATPEPRTTKRLLALSTVSRHWKHVLDQSPSVWGWIDTTMDAPFAVQKSQHAPLSINLVKEGEFGTSGLEQGFATLLPHSKRWQSLQLCLTSVAAEHFVHIFGSLSMPSLQDLSFVVDTRVVVLNDPPRVDNLDRYPLRRLELSGISTSWDTVSTFTELRSLKITNPCYGSTWLSRDHITNILLGCIHLEELALSKLEDHSPDNSVPPSSQSTFHLPVLRSVEFSNIFNERDAGLWLLDCISAPKLRGLSVMGYQLGRLIGSHIASVLKRQRTDSPFPVVMASLRSRPVHVYMTQRMCRFDCEHVLKRGVHQGVELHLPGGGFVDTCQRVADIVSGVMGDPPHPPLHVHLEKFPQSYSPNPDPDPAFLGHLPSISVLHMKRVASVEVFLHFLCSREPGDPVRYYCPKLTEIHILRASVAPSTITETLRDAVKELLEKRPNVALYDGEGRCFPHHFNDDGNQKDPRPDVHVRLNE